MRRTRGNGSGATPASLDTAPLWSVPFVLAGLVNLGTFLAFNMTNTGMPVFVDSLGASPLEVGLVTTFTTASALASRPFTGLMVDRFGGKGVLVAGAVLAAASIACFSIVPFVPAILALRFVQGIGWGLSSTAIGALVADVIPPQRFAEGMGFFSMTTSISSAIGPALSIVLLDHAGMGAMVGVALACSAAALVLACVASFTPPAAVRHSEEELQAAQERHERFQRERAQEQEREREQRPAQRHDGSGTVPADAAASPFSAPEAATAQASETPDAPDRPRERMRERPRHPVLHALFEKNAVLPGILMCLVNMAFAPIGTFIVLHGQQQGVEGIFLYFIVYAVATLVTRPAMGKLVDRVGFFGPGILASLCVSATLLMVAFSHSLLLFCVAGVFAGVGFGTAMSAFQTMAVGPVAPKRRGVATSTYLFGMNGGLAIGSLVAGLCAGPLGYAGMYVAMAFSPLVAAAVIVAVGPARLEAYRTH